MARKHTTKCCRCDPTIHQFFCALKRSGCAHHGGTVSQRIEIPDAAPRENAGSDESSDSSEDEIDDPIAESQNSYRCLFACKQHGPAEHCSNRRCCASNSAEETRRAFAAHIPVCSNCGLQYDASGALLDWSKLAVEEKGW